MPTHVHKSNYLYMLLSLHFYSTLLHFHIELWILSPVSYIGPGSINYCDQYLFQRGHVSIDLR